jgi:hypothetical protein
MHCLERSLNRQLALERHFSFWERQILFREPTKQDAAQLAGGLEALANLSRTPPRSASIMPSSEWLSAE